jgi:hypothetical protein
MQTTARIASLKKYLEDCKKMDFNKAWNLHRQRMASAQKVFAK